MMTVHELKVIQPYYAWVESGEKTFEVRKNDRNFIVGDYLQLREYRPDLACGRGDYTGNQCTRVIRHILPGGQFGIESGYVVMGLDYVD